MITVSTPAVEESTVAFQVSFTDESSPPQPMSPTTLNWSLYDINGNVINSRSLVSITPAETVTIVLSGNDLQLTSAPNQRRLVLRGTYSSSLGSGLPLVEQIHFLVEDVTGVV